MTRTNLSMSISADGYVAGPDQSEENPLGVGGISVHHWHIGPASDHPVNRQVMSEMLDGMGATIMGRNMFGPFVAYGPILTGRAGGATPRHTTARSSSSPIMDMSQSK